MDDAELDRLLAATAAPLPDPLRAEARGLARTSFPGERHLVRRRRARWVVPLVAAGAIALTAGTTATAAEMQVWPFVGLSNGEVRTDVRIPLDYVTDTGRTEHCGAYLDLRNASSSDLQKLDAAISAHDWTGFGQRLYDDGSDGGQPDQDGELRVWSDMYPALEDFAAQVFPGIVIMGHGGSGLDLSSLGARCDPDGQ